MEASLEGKVEEIAQRTLGLPPSGHMAQSHFPGDGTGAWKVSDVSYV